MKKLFTYALLPVAAFLMLLSSAVGQPSGSPATTAETVRQAWVNNYNVGFAGTAKALKVATDAAGNAYTLGQTRGGKNNTSSFLITKYSPDSQKLWQVFYNEGPYNGSTPTDLAVDAAGNVYVTGWADYYTFFGSQNIDYTTVKYSSAGDRVWMTRYDMPQSIYQSPSTDLATAVAIDAVGNVYVTGTSNGDYATVKYNAAGQQVWASRFAGGSATAADVAVDLAGNVVVTGSMAGDYATVKYSPSGQQLWVARYNSPTNGTDVAKVVAVDAAGNIVVTGSSATDYATVSYALDGQQQWVMRYSGPGNGNDAPQDMAVDAAGNTYVTGTSEGVATGADYATLKYSRTGQLLWEARYNDANGSTDQANAIALDPAGNAYVTGAANGAMVTIKYGTAGQQRWLIRYNDTNNQYNAPGPASGAAIALDKGGNVFVTGNANGLYGLTNIATLKYIQTGTTPPASCDPLATEPRTQPDQLTTKAGTSLTFSPALLVANDTDPLGRQLQVASIEKPSVGTVTRNADGTFTYAPPTGFVGQVDLTYLVQGAEPVLASRATGHYYEFVAAPGMCWTAAKTAAAGRTYQGMQGYLATITFRGEQDFLAGRQSSQYWLGASDMEVEGEWRWKTGPEAGQLIWKGDGATGRALAYTNWVAGQPDDYKNQYRPQGEDYGMLYGQSGQWNDLDECGTGAGIAGYIVEYGGLETCLPTLYSLGKATITVGSSPMALLAKTASAAATGQTQSLAAYPNPSNGQFQVRVAAQVDGLAQLDLFDLQGKKIKSLFEGSLAAGEVREVSVNNQGLTTGLYQMRLVSGSNVQMLRVSIQ